MGSLALSRPIVRAAFCVFLALLPLGTAWNLLVAAKLPAQPSGSARNSAASPTTRRWPLVADFATAISRRPWRPASPTRCRSGRFSFRSTTKVRLPAVRRTDRAASRQGAKGQLIERTIPERLLLPNRRHGRKTRRHILPKLKDIQNYYQTARRHFRLRGLAVQGRAPAGIFSSTVFPARARRQARSSWCPDYVGALEQGGIHVVDTASLIHSLKGTYPFDLFPEGGVHWNDVGGARAVSADR